MIWMVNLTLLFLFNWSSSDYGSDYAYKGVPYMVGSFELLLVRLVLKTYRVFGLWNGMN
jgi:hypothetical protein